MGALESISVAVVDDDESLCRSLARLLRARGFEPSTFPSAEALIESGPEAFDCLLVDIQLGPGLSGLEFNERLVARRASVPVIFITAHDDPEVEASALRTGCAGFFRKSDPGEAILERIHQVTAASPLSQSSSANFVIQPQLKS